MHKAEAHGETIYRLRVSGLTKADAAAMCARLKGDGGSASSLSERERARRLTSERGAANAKAFICGCAGVALNDEERASCAGMIPGG